MTAAIEKQNEMPRASLTLEINNRERHKLILPVSVATSPKMVADLASVIEPGANGEPYVIYLTIRSKASDYEGPSL